LSFTSRELTALINHVCERVIEHADQLTALDRAIGDADHGLNMLRGFQAVQGKVEVLAALSLGTALSEIGKTLVMTIGGASGPLYGTLFMRLGQELGEKDNPDRADLVRALRAAIDAVKARGKAQTGQKTMLDVLEPLYTYLHQHPDATLDAVRDIADKAAQDTIPLRAERGRASFLGERSRGHMDPGACSSALIAVAVSESLMGPHVPEPNLEEENR
jgi:dihydroxyacetone kinase-like protein